MKNLPERLRRALMGELRRPQKIFPSGYAALKKKGKKAKRAKGN
jgi:hypothetical protein